MFLNLSSDISIFYKDVVAILNVENEDEDFFNNIKANNDFVEVKGNDNVFRSAVFTSGKNNCVFLSPLSVRVIKKKFEGMLSF